MAQLYTQRQVTPDSWDMSGDPQHTSIALSVAATINYSADPSHPDTLPANTLALLPDGTSVSFDRTADVYVPYVIKGDATLRIIKESQLPTLSVDYAPLARVELHGIKPYQPEPYLAAGGTASPPVTTPVVASATTAKALSLWNGTSNNAPPSNWYTTGFDDSAWITPVDEGAAVAPTGARYLWTTGPVVESPTCKSLFRQTFSVPAGALTAATLYATFDDGCFGLYVNGTLITSSVAFGQSGVMQTFTLDPSILVVGPGNLIASAAQNNSGPPAQFASVSYRLDVTAQPAGGVGGVLGQEGDLLYFHGGQWTRLPIGATGQVLTSNGADPGWASDTDTGGVTSVAFAGPTGTSVSGSPITSSGTITLSWASQTANTFLGAPSGSSGVPTFRALVAADIPTLPASQITSGQLAAARGGTGVDGSAASNGQLLIGTGSGYALATLTAGSGVTVTNSAGGITLAATGSGGTVTSVALSMPGIFSVSGSPISTSGTLAVTLATETANTVFAGPASGSAAAPTFRAVQAADLPTAPTAGGHIHAHGHFL